MWALAGGRGLWICSPPGLCNTCRVDSRHCIRAVTLDVGGTLLEPWPSVGHVYSAVAAEHGHSGLSPDTLNRQFAAAWRRKREFDHSRAAWQEIVQATFAGLLNRGAAAALLDPLYRRFACAESWRLFDDVLPALESLRERGVRLAVISNWDERLRSLLDDLRLTPFFEKIIVSIEAGQAKPSPWIFQHCLEALRLPADAVLHAGDELREDLEGARQAGLRAVLVHRRPGPPPRESIQTLAGLLPRVA
jgi:putative hydrolase of the HAD superfamily